MKLPTPFLVLATQNPIDQEGTYLLPEAQTDRFMLKCKIDYPEFEEEKTSHENGFYFGYSSNKTCDFFGTNCRSKKIINQIYLDEK